MCCNSAHMRHGNKRFFLVVFIGYFSYFGSALQDVLFPFYHQLMYV